MKLFIPSMILNNDDDHVFSACKEIFKSICFNYPYTRPCPDEENVFWTNLLKKHSGSKNIDFDIYKNMLDLINDEKINFYLAFKYFINRILWENDLYPHIKRIDYISFDLHCHGYQRLPREIILNSEFLKIPQALIPNLAYGIYKNCLDYSKIISGDLSKLCNVNYSYSLKLALNNKRISLTDEYLNRIEEDQEFIDKELLISLLSQATNDEMQKIEEFIENAK